MTVSIEQWQAGRAVEGVPPWDGTGFPFPFNSDGSPAWPGGSEPITVTPGSTQTVASTDPNVVAEPTTAWADDEFATFTDGDFTWDGDSWEPYVPAVPLALTVLISPDPLAVDVEGLATITANVAPTAPPVVTYSINEGTTWAPVPNAVTEVSATEWTTVLPAGLQPTADNYLSVKAVADGVEGIDVITVVAGAAADPNMGWTVAELREFAADHNPPIDIPSSATTKAQILQVILAYLAGHPEEN